MHIRAHRGERKDKRRRTRIWQIGCEAVIFEFCPLGRSAPGADSPNRPRPFDRPSLGWRERATPAVTSAGGATILGRRCLSERGNTHGPAVSRAGKFVAHSGNAFGPSSG